MDQGLHFDHGPLATVVIGGIVSAALLTLVVLPVVYGWLFRGYRAG